MSTLTALPRSLRRALAALADERASESGVTLIEVVISAMLVAVIVVGTLTGFDTSSRATVSERQRNQATLLAGQNEERLRGMNVTELGHLGVTTTPETLNGTEFTVESKAQFVSSGKEEFTCETSGGTADYIQTTSKVSWAALSHRTEPESVSQSSLIPVPTSTSLLVNVHDQANSGVEGASVKVVGEASGTTYEQTTPQSGCVIFGAMPDKKVKITATKSGWINEKLEAEPAAIEAQLSTTSLVNKTFTIAAPGTLSVEFVAASGGGSVQGDTAYVAHTGAPEKTVGSAGAYSSTLSVTPLWPYQTAGSPPGKSPYTVYAGCKETNPNTLSKGEVTLPTPQVEPGQTTSVKAELPQVSLKLYEGSSSGSAGSPDSKAEAKLTYCGSSRTMKTTATGALEQPYTPFSKVTICLTQTISGQRYKYSTEVSNTTRAGVTLGPLYMSSSTYKSSSGC